MSSFIDIPKAAFDAMREMARDPSRRTALVQDDTCMGGLVLVLSNPDKDIVKNALEILLMLAECAEHRYTMKNFLGLVDQLQMLIIHKDFAVQELSKKVYGYINRQTPLKDTANTHRQSTETQHKCKEGATKKDAGQKKRRNSFFVGGLAKNRMIILQIRGMYNKDDMDTCRNCLLTVKGVISIIMDYSKKRATLRTVLDLKPELLAQAISRTMTMVAEQVVKDDDGNEIMLSFGSNVAAVNKENEDMPDYPEDDLSPVTGDKNVARRGDPSKKKGWGFVKSVGNFISNSFYW